MQIYPLQIVFSGYAIIGLTLLILAASTAVYLLRLSSKSQATWSLIGFFSMVALSGGATVLANAFLYWDRLFVPWQDFWILAGGVALAQFAYSLPRYEPSLEAKSVRVVMGGLAFLALAYCFIFDYRFLFDWTPQLDVSDAYYLLLPVGTLLIVMIFLRRSVQFSIQAESLSRSRSETRDIWQHLIHPQGEDAKVLRSLAFALSLAFLPGLQTLFGFPYPYGFILSNIGSILAIVAIALVYFNYAPEVNSFMAKLVGITLTSVLLIFAISGSMDIYNAQSDFSAARWQMIASIHSALIKTGEFFADDPLQVAYVVSWDSTKPQVAGAYRQIFRADGEVHFALDRFIDENRKGYLEIWSHPVTGTLAKLTNDDFRSVQRYWTYPLGSAQEDYQSYIFVAGGTAYEIGFSSAAADEYLSVIVSKWLILILISSAFVLLIFPLFFRRTLVEPLNNLLDGITRVNQGNLDTADTAAQQLKHWDKSIKEIKLGGMGIITEENGELKTHLVGVRAAGTGAKWGTIIGATGGLATGVMAVMGVLTGGLGLIPGAVAGLAVGAASGALLHKRIGMSDEDRTRLQAHLKDGGAALAVMVDDYEVESTKTEITSLGGDVNHFVLPEQVMDEAEETVQTISDAQEASPSGELASSQD